MVCRRLPRPSCIYMYAGVYLLYLRLYLRLCLSGWSTISAEVFVAIRLSRLGSARRYLHDHWNISTDEALRASILPPPLRVYRILAGSGAALVLYLRLCLRLRLFGGLICVFACVCPWYFCVCVCRGGLLLRLQYWLPLGCRVLAPHAIACRVIGVSHVNFLQIPRPSEARGAAS